MSKTALYVTMGVIFGTALGAGVTYKALDIKYAKELEEKVNKEMAALHDMSERTKAETVLHEEPEAKVVANKWAEKPDIEALNTLTEDYKTSEPDADLEPLLPEEEEVVTDPDDIPMSVISKSQYEDENPRFDKITLTYFEGDDVLCDETETPIRDTEGLIGPDALGSFGKDSGDRNVVYVRNLDVETDFEVIKDPRSFEAVVLGYSPKKVIGKMRDGYEE